MTCLTRPLALFAVIACLTACTSTHPVDRGTRLYVMDCGRLVFEDIKDFGLTNEESPVRELFVPCYLIDHPRGRLLWDAGLPLTVPGAGTVTLQPGVTMTYARSLPDQLDELGYHPQDIGLVAFSHMHFDHVGAANLFTAATLLIQEAEWVAAFEEADKYPVFEPSLYEGLRYNERVLLDGDHDVFGDGRVVILSAPGHTPGHQVLQLALEDTGPLILSGDLYHFRKSRSGRRTPVFNTSREETLASMTRIEALLLETGATLWIEHDLELARSLRLAPAYYR